MVIIGNQNREMNGFGNINWSPTTMKIFLATPKVDVDTIILVVISLPLTTTTSSCRKKNNDGKNVIVITFNDHISRR